MKFFRRRNAAPPIQEPGNEISEGDPGTSPTKVRLVAAAYIPWQAIHVYESGLFSYPPFGALGLRYYLEGDGRVPADRSADIGEKFRLRGEVEVDVVQRGSEGCRTEVRQQVSHARHAVEGPILPAFTDLEVDKTLLKAGLGGKAIAETAVARRLDPHTVKVRLILSGKVPFLLAGPQFPIDIDYTILLKYDAAEATVRWEVSTCHDRFPAHEFFLESSDGVQFRWHYCPTWFADPTLERAYPSMRTMIRARGALKGVHPIEGTCHGSFRVGGAAAPP